MDELEKRMEKHEQDDERNFAVLQRVIFGDKETGEKGMKDKVDEMHTILVQAKGLGGFFGGIRGIILTAVAVGALAAYIRGWIK